MRRTTLNEGPPPAPIAKPTLGRYEGWIIFALACTLNLITAWWLAYVWSVGNSDALSRTANAFYVLFSRDPHLAAIGFVWPPLPSLMQLPILLFTRWLGQPQFSGPILSSVSGAVALVILNLILAQLNVSRALRWGLLVLTQLHPSFWYLAASGLAEIILLCCLLLTIWGYLLMPERVRSWAIAGLGLALGFFVRYEALAMIAGIVLAIAIQRWPPWRNWETALEGRLLFVLSPPAYAIGLWLYFNWMFTSDPLFFQRSAYSLAVAPDVARNVGLAHPLFAAMGNWIKTGEYALTRLAQQNLAFLVAMPVILGLALRRSKMPLLGLLVLLASVPLFTAYQVYSGTLATWMRYWFYATPFAAILIGAWHGASTGTRRWVVTLGLFGLFVASTPVTLLAMRDPYASLDEQRLSAYLTDSAQQIKLREQDGYWKDIQDAHKLARRVYERAGERRVMVDTARGYAMIMQYPQPERLVITTDRDFVTILENPPAFVDYVLVLAPETSGAGFNVIAARYPHLFENGTPWAKLEEDFTDTYRHWRLFRVTRLSSQ
ncbi:MAG: glycosyltransferase family 39 protein [Anaerolineae bacterium]|nr:glycosyltransferase family 39 protein [Anaerolineae bacterium]